MVQDMKNQTKNKSRPEKGPMRPCGLWAVGSICIVLLAVAVRWRSYPKIDPIGSQIQLNAAFGYEVSGLPDYDSFGILQGTHKYSGFVEDCCSETTYVNLQLNPERYTGYSGPSARRIWDAVYSENCPKYPSEEMCQEERILYKLISGLHSSISVHIASEYLLEEATNMAAEYLTYADYSTGNPTEDLKAQSLMRELLCNPTLQSACPLPFDEAKLWKGQSGPELKYKIQKQFRNISTIMDCVGCEKCRLWGKPQVLGLGTALKILFLVDGKEHPAQPLELQRKELIALMNLLNRLSESVKFVKEMGPKAEAIEGGRKPPLFRVALYTACGPRAE
ncbi:hypothetical protein SAY87_003481 [Trapa incisa]|uniref:Endoplasmic reticulum oxidoreductin 1 n=1 Tax=Trapa incisa TaxID=236973 RepID=A0AAN7KRG4_9MYRT|nr:hypothetical protein SAY87_003481 [Trapa incisa]